MVSWLSFVISLAFPFFAQHAPAAEPTKPAKVCMEEDADCQEIDVAAQLQTAELQLGAEAKLDRILSKLEQIEKRLDALEHAKTACTTDVSEPEALPLSPNFRLLNQLPSHQGQDGAWIINMYDPDPNIRMRQLLNNDPFIRTITDQPSHLTPNRVEGGIQ